MAEAWSQYSSLRTMECPTKLWRVHGILGERRAAPLWWCVPWKGDRGELKAEADIKLRPRSCGGDWMWWRGGIWGTIGLEGDIGLGMDMGSRGGGGGAWL
mmetsp:Transcript_41702/g.89537  ORF Transcript_41702/g.89537 Transcript_41702/m.89537 type:complete len:100 (-) Transcript_41702:1439-1738(-)